jgi:hypothetical protein
VCEGVRYEVAGGRLECEELGTLLRRKERNGIEDDRRSAVDLLVGLDPGPVVRLDSTDRRSHDLELCPFFLERLGEPLQDLRVGAVGDQGAELPTCE